MNYWLSGMGAYCCYRPSNKDMVPAGKPPPMTAQSPLTHTRPLKTWYMMFCSYVDVLKWYVAMDNLNPAKTTAGFTSYEVTKQGMVVKFYDQDGAVLYTGPTVLPRKL